MAHGHVLYIYTDGSCLGNPGPGGWAWAITDGEDILDEGSGGKAHTTNNEMELQAVLEALSHAPTSKGYIMVLDSKYVINALSQWYKKWQSNGWTASNKKPVEHQEIIQKTVALYSKVKILKWQWVQGHSGDQFNSHVDRAAGAASRQASRDSRQGGSREPSPITRTNTGHALAELAFRKTISDAVDKFCQDIKG